MRTNLQKKQNNHKKTKQKNKQTNSVNVWLINRTSACDQHRLTKVAPTKSALLFIINVCTVAHLHAYVYSMIPYLF